MRRALPLLLAAVTLASACGPTPPDYKGLAKVKVTLTNCGHVTFTAADIVHAAYQEKTLGDLPSPQSLPTGTILGGGQTAVTPALQRTLPCAKDPASGQASLEKLGYTHVTGAGTGTYLDLYKGTDPYGVPGTYALFKCGFVGDMNQNLTGAFASQGLHGTFGADAGPVVDAAAVRTFAALTFRTHTTQLADVSTLPAYQDRKLVFLSMEKTLDTSGRIKDGNGNPLQSLGLCAAWIVPNFYGGCDSVAVGNSFTVLTDDKGDFQQTPLNPGPLDIFRGYCGRTQ